MFTGIIEEAGRLVSVRKTALSSVLTIAASHILDGVRTGDSIAVNGICLTVTMHSSSAFSADVMPETFRRSALSALSPGSPVNLERAMPANGRFGGHIVTGHIDGTGVIRSVSQEGNAVWYRIRTSPDILRLVVEKGSIAIDGISLTVARVTADDFSVSIIPHTLASTSLPHKTAGSAVNLETDCIGKYVVRLLAADDGGPLAPIFARSRSQERD